jgi:hypothetical protein
MAILIGEEPPGVGLADRVLTSEPASTRACRSSAATLGVSKNGPNRSPALVAKRIRGSVSTPLRTYDHPLAGRSRTALQRLRGPKKLLIGKMCRGEQARKFYVRCFGHANCFLPRANGRRLDPLAVVRLTTSTQSLCSEPGTYSLRRAK